MEEHKTHWPELMGVDGPVAVETIKKENPNLNVIQMNSNQPMTRDYRMDRVRVIVDPQTQKVVTEPRCG